MLASCFTQEHEAWLEEPQEMANIDPSKTDPLLGDSSHAKKDAGVKVMKEGKQMQAPDNMPDKDITDSVTQKQVAEKLNQV